MAIRIDKAGRTGFLASVQNTEDAVMLQGQVLELGDYIEPDVFGATAVKDVASDKLVILATPENLLPGEDDFELAKGEIARAYYPETGQVFTLPKTMFDGVIAVKDLVEPAVGQVKWAKATTPTAKVYAEVIEETVFAGQECLVIHIFKA